MTELHASREMISQAIADQGPEESAERWIMQTALQAHELLALVRSLSDALTRAVGQVDNLGYVPLESITETLESAREWVEE